MGKQARRGRPARRADAGRKPARNAPTARGRQAGAAPPAGGHRQIRLSEMKVVVDGRGRIKSIQTGRKGVTAEDKEEARRFIETLDANHQIARRPGPLPSGTTHKMESTGKVTRRLTRKRFSAR